MGKSPGPERDALRKVSSTLFNSPSYIYPKPEKCPVIQGLVNKVNLKGILRIMHNVWVP